RLWPLELDPGFPGCQKIMKGGPEIQHQALRRRQLAAVQFFRGGRYGLRPVIRLTDNIELGRDRRIADPPQFNLKAEDPEIIAGDLIEPSSAARCSRVNLAAIQTIVTAFSPAAYVRSCPRWRWSVCSS